MSDPVRLLLVGATGLIGGEVVRQSSGAANIALAALARRAPAPERHPGTLLLGEPAEWPRLIAEARPDVLASALGTTWRAAGRSEDAFRAVDQHLVLACARAARTAGARRCIAVSSVGADAGSRSFYLRVKGEVEEALALIGFARLDILRPGLLRGQRGGERRVGERLAILASPVSDRLLRGPARRYRSIPGETVAAAMLALAGRTAPGHFVHENDAIRQLAAD